VRDPQDGWAGISRSLRLTTAANRAARQGLGQMIPIALGGIDQVHAQLTGPIYEPIKLTQG
jgi:hypothetical protein